MTPPPEPRTAAGLAYLEKLERDDAGMQKLSSGRFHLGAITADARTAVIAIEAEAAGAPLREALADVLRKWDRWYITTPEGERPNNVEFLAVKKAVIEASEALGRAATPAPYDGHYSVTGKLSHSTTATPAPEPFYDSDGIPIPDELFAALEQPAPAPHTLADCRDAVEQHTGAAPYKPASLERSDPALLWHGDGDECTGIHCGNPEHGWTELAPAYVECPSCDDASAAHIAGLHEEPAPDKAASLTARQSEAAMPASAPSNHDNPLLDTQGLPKHRLRPASAPLDVERLAQAIDEFITSQTGFDVDDAEAIAAIYARLTARAAATEDA